MELGNHSTGADPEPLSIYLHIPFCSTRCTYCAFNTFARAEPLIPSYVAALCAELRRLGQVTPGRVHTLYFGGGTPSLLTPAQVGDILSVFREAFQLGPSVEITLESNPGSLDSAYLARLCEYGVNRLSIGMQSIHADELRMMARDHDPDAVPRAVADARSAGFENLSLDLIFGLPGQTLARWVESVQEALALSPDHLSMYALELEPGTVMTRDVGRGRLPFPDEDCAVAMYEAADCLAEGAGLLQYEISNWSRPGFECRHNLQYWWYGPYLGVGAGAHGFAAGVRYENVRSIRQFIALATQQTAPPAYPLTAAVAHVETIDARAAMAEYLFTGLRLVQTGVSLAGFQQRFGISLEAAYGPALDQLARAGMIDQHSGRLRLTPAARLLSNQVFRRLV
jgi:oxygen-independent coproporphyrinogen-3 oxidase